MHGWDNTPRSGRNGGVLVGATPELFLRVLEQNIERLQDRPPEQRLLFLKAWNEWAEGNHLEPDLKSGTGFLQAVAEALRVVPDMRHEAPMVPVECRDTHDAASVYRVNLR